MNMKNRNNKKDVTIQDLYSQLNEIEKWEEKNINGVIIKYPIKFKTKKQIQESSLKRQ